MLPKLPTCLFLIAISGFLGFQIRAAPALDTLACTQSAIHTGQQVFDTLQFWR